MARLPFLPLPLIEAMHDNDAVCFAGAGISASRFPLWRSLLDDLLARAYYAGRLLKHEYTYLAERMEAGELETVAQRLEDRDSRWVQRQLREVFEEQELEPGPVLESLAQTPFRGFLTTNFDPQIEATLLGLKPIYRDAVVEGSELPDRFLVKLHVSVEADGTRHYHLSYRDILSLMHAAQETPFSRLVHGMMDTRTVCFVGTSLRDSFVVSLLTALNLRRLAVDPEGHQRPATNIYGDTETVRPAKLVSRKFALLRAKECDTFRADALSRDLGVEPILYAEHEDLPAVFEALTAFATTRFSENWYYHAARGGADVASHETELSVLRSASQEGAKITLMAWFPSIYLRDGSIPLPLAEYFFRNYGIKHKVALEEAVGLVDARRQALVEAVEAGRALDVHFFESDLLNMLDEASPAHFITPIPRCDMLRRLRFLAGLDRWHDHVRVFVHGEGQHHHPGANSICVATGEGSGRAILFGGRTTDLVTDNPGVIGGLQRHAEQLAGQKVRRLAEFLAGLEGDTGGGHPPCLADHMPLCRTPGCAVARTDFQATTSWFDQDAIAQATETLPAMLAQAAAIRFADGAYVTLDGTDNLRHDRKPSFGLSLVWTPADPDLTDAFDRVVVRMNALAGEGWGEESPFVCRPADSRHALITGLQRGKPARTISPEAFAKASERLREMVATPEGIPGDGPLAALELRFFRAVLTTHGDVIVSATAEGDASWRTLQALRFAFPPRLMPPIPLDPPKYNSFGLHVTLGSFVCLPAPVPEIQSALDATWPEPLSVTADSLQLVLFGDRSLISRPEIASVTLA